MKAMPNGDSTMATLSKAWYHITEIIGSRAERHLPRSYYTHWVKRWKAGAVNAAVAPSELRLILKGILRAPRALRRVWP